MAEDSFGAEVDDGVDVTDGGSGKFADVAGGSICVETAGGGKDAIASSAEEVSTVICFVETFAFRNV